MKIIHMLLFVALVLPACGEPESEFDRLIERLCARQGHPAFLDALRASVQTGETLRDPEYWAIRKALDELGAGNLAEHDRAVQFRCPEAYWEAQSIREGVNLRGNARLDQLAVRACERLRDPGVAAWLAGEAGVVVDRELVEIFQAGWEVEHADTWIELMTWDHCPELEGRVQAAVRIVSGGWEMVHARARSEETCAKLEHALGQREAARAGALALAWTSEVAKVERGDRTTVPALRRALEERCPETAAAVSTLPG